MNKFISDIFKPFNIDIVDTLYKGKKDKFIVFQVYEEENLYADNRPQSYQYSGNFRFYSNQMTKTDPTPFILIHSKK